MRTSTLLARNLTWFCLTILAVLLGVATASAVLAGALSTTVALTGSAVLLAGAGLLIATTADGNPTS